MYKSRLCFTYPDATLISSPCFTNPVCSSPVQYNLHARSTEFEILFASYQATSTWKGDMQRLAAFLCIDKPLLQWRAQSCLISQVRSRNLFAERTSRLSIFVLSRATQSALLRNLFLAWIPIHLSQLIVKLSMMAMVLVRDIRQKVDTWYLEKHEKNRELGLVITWFCKRHARVKSY